MSKKIEYKEGQVLNGCIYLYEVPPKTQPCGQRKRRAKFRCYCGKEFETTIDAVKSEQTNSCGCWNIESSIQHATIHGLKGHPVYSVWKNMRNRCLAKDNEAYKHYGARGITICDEWDDPKSFYDYVTQLPDYGKEGYTLDRKENDGNYEPGNMRWADRHTQTANRRTHKGNKSGYSGVFIRESGKCAASIGVNHERIHIGTFATPEDAAKARDKYIIDNELNEYPLSGL